MLLLARFSCICVGVIGLSLAASAVLDLQHTTFFGIGLLAAVSAMAIGREDER